MADFGGEESFDHLIEKFNHLDLESENIDDVITNLKVAVFNDDEKLSYAVSNVNLLAVFDFLIKVTKNVSASKTLIQDILHIMEKVLSKMDISEISDILQRTQLANAALSTQNEKLIHFLLSQLKRIGEESPENIVRNEEYVKMFIICLASESLNIASLSHKIIKTLCSLERNLAGFFSSENLKFCRGVIMDISHKKSSVVKFRFYDLFIDLILIEPTYLATFDSNEFNLVSGLMEELNGNDILSELNALEIISKIAVFQEGLHLLKEKGIFNWLERAILSEDINNFLLLPGAIKCFGNLAVLQPFDVLPNHANITQKIVALLEHNDPSICCLCAETLCLLASREGVLSLLYKNPDMMKHAAFVMGKIIQNYSAGEHARRRTLDSLVLLFHQSSENVEASMICEKLYSYVNDNTVQLIFDIMKQPYAELKLGALNLLKSLSNFTWVEQDIALCGGFLEYLVNRGTEHEKVGLEIKYDIIANLVSSATSKENLGVVSYNKLKQYKDEGPFYSETQVRVELEEMT